MLWSFIYGVIGVPFLFLARFGILIGLVSIVGIGDGQTSTESKINGAVFLLIVLVTGLVLGAFLIKSYVDVYKASYIPTARKRMFVYTWICIWIISLISLTQWRW